MSRAQVGMERVAICELSFAESRGPGGFGIFLRFCGAGVAMKKFAYGVNAGEIRAASPKGGPLNPLLLYHIGGGLSSSGPQKIFVKLYKKMGGIKIPQKS